MIAIIGAMQEELDPIKNQLKTVSHQILGSVNFYKGQLDKVEVVVVHSKIGKVNAAVATTLAIQLYQPAYIINIGTLAALDKELQIGAIILSESATYHDVDVTKFGYAHGQVPQMPVDYQASHKLLKLFETLAQQKNLISYNGIIATGDQFIASITALQTIKEKFLNTMGIDMETAAIAQVAHLFEIPFISVRGVTDHATEGSPESFKKNLVNVANVVGALVISAISDTIL